MAPRYDAIILGAGLSGLTIAHRLQTQGKRVCVLEKAPRPGGIIRGERRGGLLCEAGPNSLLIKEAAVAAYLDELGLSGSLVPANPEAGKRFLVRAGKVEPLPSSLIAAIRTPLYSRRAKLRFLREPWQPATEGDDTSVAEFVSRRLGPEFLDYGIAPLVSGIFAGDPATLSMRHAFPRVWHLEKRAGSLIRGSLALRKERRPRGEKPFRSQMVSFQEGLETLPKAQAATLGKALSPGAEIERIEHSRADGLWSVSWQTSSGRQAASSARLIVTAPIHAWGNLPFAPEVAGALAALPVVHHPPVSTLVLGFRREQVQHALDGFGMLLPPVENEPILGSIFSSSIFPDRAPAGHVALMNFLGGSTRPESASLETDQAVQTTLDVLRRLLGVQDNPVFAHHTRWPRAIPQYHVGYGSFLDGLANIERAYPGLRFQGNFRGGPGLSDVIANAMHAAERA